MQVRFVERYGKYFPGANPLLEPALAAALIARGVCRPMCAEAAPQVAASEPPVEEPTDVDAEAPTLPVEEVKPAPAQHRGPRRR